MADYIDTVLKSMIQEIEIGSQKIRNKDNGSIRTSSLIIQNSKIN